MTDGPRPEQILTVPLIGVPELPFRWLVQPDTINGVPAAHLVLSLPNTTMRTTWDGNNGIDMATQILEAFYGPAKPEQAGGLTVVERDGIVAPGHPDWNGGTG